MHHLCIVLNIVEQKKKKTKTKKKTQGKGNAWKTKQEKISSNVSE